jgi:hypothetical protein
LSFDVDQKKEKREGVKLAALLWLKKLGKWSLEVVIR